MTETAATHRLYFEDASMLAFDATVVGHASHDGRPALVLDRTAFYPEGGGQLSDRGRIDGVVVEDVQSDAEGRVLHVVDAPLVPVGTSVHASVDPSHRSAQTVLHSAQHVLSQALYAHAGAETVSARLGADSGSIDTDQKAIAPEKLVAAVEAVHALIDADEAVNARVVAADELATLPLRSPPKVNGEVRVVFAGAYDVTPCGGTHVSRTSQMGLVHITHTERVKGRTRVHFVAGPTARAYLGHADDVLREVCAALTCGRDALADVLQKQRAEIKAQKQTLGQLYSDIAERDAAVHVARGLGVLVIKTQGRDEAYLRALGAALQRAQRAAVVLHDADGHTDVILSAPGAAPFSCSDLLVALKAAHSGRGGGKAEGARARFNADADALCATALKQFSDAGIAVVEGE